MSKRHVRDDVRAAIGIQSLNLTPQEQYLFQHHIYNLHNLGTGGVLNPDGGYSTVLQRVVPGPDGRFYNVPSVWNGRVLNEDQAAEKAAAVGWDKWPAYTTPEAADARYMQMHQFMDVPMPVKPPSSLGPR